MDEDQLSLCQADRERLRRPDPTWVISEPFHDRLSRVTFNDVSPPKDHTSDNPIPQSAAPRRVVGITLAGGRRWPEPLSALCAGERNPRPIGPSRQPCRVSVEQRTAPRYRYLRHRRVSAADALQRRRYCRAARASRRRAGSETRLAAGRADAVDARLP